MPAAPIPTATCVFVGWCLHATGTTPHCPNAPPPPTVRHCPAPPAPPHTVSMMPLWRSTSGAWQPARRWWWAGCAPTRRRPTGPPRSCCWRPWRPGCRTGLGGRTSTVRRGGRWERGGRGRAPGGRCAPGLAADVATAGGGLRVGEGAAREPQGQCLAAELTSGSSGQIQFDSDSCIHGGAPPPLPPPRALVNLPAPPPPAPAPSNLGHCPLPPRRPARGPLLLGVSDVARRSSADQ